MFKNQISFIKIVYGALLISLGVLIWLLWQTKTQNYVITSARFDGALIDILSKNNIEDKDILVQFRKEKKSGTSIWVEYYKKIKLNKSVDENKLIEQIKAASKKRDLLFITQKTNGNLYIEVGRPTKVFSKLDLIIGSKKQKKKKVAIVIDDIGYQKDISGYLNLGIPITFAILPFERYSKSIAQKLSSQKIPYILHLPLEPEGYPKVDPGKAALLITMNAKEIRNKFNANLSNVSGACGVSNHMGSRFSADYRKMRILLSLVKDNNIFYFDSYTTPKSQAKKVADEIGLKFIRNELFLDSKDELGYMKQQLQILLKNAKTRGSSIAIGHIQRKYMLQAIRESIPLFRKADIEFVYLKDLVQN